VDSPLTDALARVGPVSSGAEFNTESAWRTMRDACELANLDTADAELIRLGENALFQLPAHDLVVRIARTGDYWDDAQREVDVARWLADVPFPAAEVADLDQPIEAAGHPVTFWQFIHGHTAERGEIGRLGALLRDLHQLRPPASLDLPPEDILGRVEPRITTAPIPDEDRSFLLNRVHELAEQLPKLAYPLPPGPTHGDAHIGNLMITEGQPVLIDFERFAWGQPEWDLAMTATEYRTAGWWSDAEYAQFADAYGWDVTGWDGFDVLRAVHEIKMTTWIMQNVDESAEIRAEYGNRMQTLRGSGSPEWQPF
jgi:aminoglycoside phosphotransferase (APT) family kinase protein